MSQSNLDVVFHLTTLFTSYNAHVTSLGLTPSPRLSCLSVPSFPSLPPFLLLPSPTSLPYSSIRLSSRPTHWHLADHDEPGPPKTFRPPPTKRKVARCRPCDGATLHQPPAPPDARVPPPALPLPASAEPAQAVRDYDPQEQPQQRDILRRVPL